MYSQEYRLGCVVPDRHIDAAVTQGACGGLARFAQTQYGDALARLAKNLGMRHSGRP